MQETGQENSAAYRAYRDVVRPAVYAGCVALIFPPAIATCEAAGAAVIETKLSNWLAEVNTIWRKTQKAEETIRGLTRRCDHTALLAGRYKKKSGQLRSELRTTQVFMQDDYCRDMMEDADLKGPFKEQLEAVVGACDDITNSLQ